MTDSEIKKMWYNFYASSLCLFMNDYKKEFMIKKNETFEDGMTRIKKLIKKEKEMITTIKEENKKDLNICNRCTHKGICKYEEDALIFVNQMDVFYKNNAPSDLLLTYDVKCELFKPDSIDVTITDPNDYIAKADSFASYGHGV